MTLQEHRLRRLDLIIDLRACMKEWGDCEASLEMSTRQAEHMPLDQLEEAVARWIRIIEARRQKPNGTGTTTLRGGADTGRGAVRPWSEC